MTFTPSSRSSFISGLVFWMFGWLGVLKMNEMVAFFGMKDRRPTRAILSWVNRHKIVTLAVTEGVNYGTHGITNPLSVDFALGGTIMNFFVVFFIVPLWCAFFGREAK